MLPEDKPLSNVDILNAVKLLKIKHFRGVFMRDKLPAKKRKIECGIINLDNNSGPGTHWVAYKIKHNTFIYFDSFGNLQPPKEFVDYVGHGHRILYNYNRYQNFNTVNCGHLCLRFLLNKK